MRKIKEILAYIGDWFQLAFKKSTKSMLREDKRSRNPLQNKSIILWSLVGISSVLVIYTAVFKEHKFDKFSGRKKVEKIKSTKIGNLSAVKEARFKRKGAAKNGSRGIDQRASLAVEKVFKNLPSSQQCEDVFDLVKSGKLLDSDQEKIYKTCIDENVLNLDEDQLAAMRTLKEEGANLTEAERELLTKMANGELKKGSKEYEIAKGLSSSDPDKRKIAKILANNPDLSEEEIEQLLGALRGDIPIEDVEGILARFSEDGTSIAEVGEDLSGEADMASLAQRIADRAKTIEDLESELEEGKGEYDRILDKIKKSGWDSLSDDEKTFFQKYNDKKSRLEALKAEQERDLQTYADMKNRLLEESLMADDMVKSALGANGAIFSDSFVSCEDLQSKIIVKREKAKKKKKRRKRGPKKKLVKVNPELLKLLELEEKIEEDDVFKNMKVSYINPNDLDGGQGLEADNFYISQNRDDGKIELLPGLKLRGMLTESMAIAEGSSGDSFNIALQEDVKDPLTNKIIMNKNSIAIGTAQSPDVNTKAVKVNITQVVTGNRVEKVNLFAVIPGKVVSNRKELLAEIGISGIFSGLAEGLSGLGSSEEDDTVTQDELVAALTNSGWEISADVADKIGQMLSSDLKKQKKIFFAPNGSPVILKAR